MLEGTSLEGLRKITKWFSLDSRCFSRNSNWVALEYQSTGERLLDGRCCTSKKETNEGVHLHVDYKIYVL
jgi:hypothetical protein